MYSSIGVCGEEKGAGVRAEGGSFIYARVIMVYEDFTDGGTSISRWLKSGF